MPLLSGVFFFFYVAVASVLGFMTAMGCTGYTASKHATEGFYGCLRMEMAPFGVGKLCFFMYMYEVCVYVCVLV